ncbi:MAG: phosphotransferase family protein [Aestuariivirga sp.]|uniref:phosphotransferase family protein n=1 Tax=Aestuariivirga sp. TaxID=2650926 RepID=UPI0038D0F93F
MKIDRQQAFSGTTAADIETGSLEDYLAQNVAGFAGPLTLARFRGGQSNPTYRLDTPERCYVLRRKPFGRLLPSAHAIEREYRVTAALATAGFPVARPLHLCTDDSVIGAAFYVMEHVDGRVFWQPHAPGITGEERAALFTSLNETIARLHRLDPAALGLDGFGRPEGYMARQIRRWSEQYRASETETVAAMDRLIAWLPGACPPAAGAAIVHGDFRLDNCIIANDQPCVAAVLDWELSTIGDPLADFTYHLMQWFMPVSETGAGVGSLIGHLDAPGLPRLEDYVADYCRRTGRPGIPDLDIYMAYNFFRLAAILQGILGRVRDGTAANADAAAMARQVRPLAETAWAFARKAGA